MRAWISVIAFLYLGCAIDSSDAAPSHPHPADDPDAGPLPATGGPGASGEPRSTGFYGLRLRLPIPAGESHVFTRGYETGTHVDYRMPHMDDRFAIDLAGEGCSSWRTPIVAAASGVVFFNGDHGYGNNLFLDHGNGCETHYAHLDEIVVTDGQWAHQGQLLGYEGNTGHARGSACAAHPGTHLHFVTMCYGEGVLPEPISGYWGLRGREGATLVSDNVDFARHPPGTLVITREGPRVYLIDDEGRLRWLVDEDALRSRRLFRDFSDPFGLVVAISPAEFACYAHGPPLEWPVTMRVTRCADGGHYLAVDDRGNRRRWWIPGAPGSALFRSVIQSWGFRESEVVSDHAGCGWPLAEASLYLRDGTVAQDGGRYAYVAHDGYAYGMRAEMMQAFHLSHSVLEIPVGSLNVLTRGIDSSHPELVWEDLAGCGGALPPPMVPDDQPDAFGGFGGAFPAGDPGGDADAGVPSPSDAGVSCEPRTESCNARDDDCDGLVDEGACGAAPMPDAGVPAAADAGSASCGHTVRLRFSGYAGGWHVGSDLYSPERSGVVYRDVSGTFDGSWGCEPSGWIRLNGAIADRWMCEEWPLGTFRTPYGLPEAWVDGVSATVSPWHDPSIPGGIGCNLHVCVGGGCPP